MPSFINLTQIIDPPKCHYKIIDGRDFSSQLSVKNVRVGDRVEHIWLCETATLKDSFGKSNKEGSNEIAQIYGLLIHSCFMDDGRGRKELILDDNGYVTKVFDLKKYLKTNCF